MPGLYGILDMGRVALLTQQRGIDITGNNISNVNTPGYTRQRVNMEQSEPIPFSPGQLGTGVRASEIQRIYDRFLGSQINNEQQYLGRWEAQKGALERVEIIFNESEGNGLSKVMGEFWNAWQDLVNNPSGHVQRVSVVEKGKTLALTFNQTSYELKQIQADLDASIRGTVEEINRITEQITDLNLKVSQVEVTGQNANTYRDQRDLLLKDLSELIDITTFEENDGQVSVLTGGGRPLVQNASSWNLSTQINADGFNDVVWIDSGGNSTDITGDISGGKLKGWLTVRDDTVPDYLTRLDDLAAGIISEVNTLHTTGFDINNNAGQAFFNGTTASDIEVNPNIANDPNLVAAAQIAGGAPGDNSNALAIAELQNTLTMAGNTATFDDFYNSIISDVGSGVQTATANFDHQISMATYLDNYREAISGVSIDEEMVNLIKFQHACGAAAKLIQTVDEVLEMVINM